MGRKTKRQKREEDWEIKDALSQANLTAEQAVFQAYTSRLLGYLGKEEESKGFENDARQFMDYSIKIYEGLELEKEADKLREKIEKTLHPPKPRHYMGIAQIASTFFFLLSFLFMGFILTGNAISNFSSREQNFLSAIFFILAILSFILSRVKLE